MALISPNDMTLLHAASEVAAVAASASFEHELMIVASVINNAANTGAYQAGYNKPISKAVMEKLEDAGYEVIANNVAAVPDQNYIIRWSEQ